MSKGFFQNKLFIIFFLFVCVGLYPSFIETIVLGPVESPLFAQNTSSNEKNTNFSLTKTDYQWNGTESTDWQNPLNWTPASIPEKGATITIPTGCVNYPILTTSIDILYESAGISEGSIIIDYDAVAPAQLDLGGFDITADLVANNGIIRLQGKETIYAEKQNGNNSIIDYYGTGLPNEYDVANIWGSKYEN
ncbi:MAG: hypothetical protein ACRC5H_02380, partial [Treponemataceae bacterium]